MYISTAYRLYIAQERTAADGDSQSHNFRVAAQARRSRRSALPEMRLLRPRTLSLQRLHIFFPNRTQLTVPQLGLSISAANSAAKAEARELAQSCLHFLPFDLPPMNRPRLQGSQHLSLTESHLSVEGTVPAADLSASEPPTKLSDASTNSGEETLADEQEQERDVQQVHDVEKGEKPGVKPVGEGGRPPPLAADGTPVIVVDWKGADDPAFPKNW